MHTRELIAYLLNNDIVQSENHLKKVIASALSITENGAYKKMKGMNKLTFDEVGLLLHELGLQLHIGTSTMAQPHYEYPFMSDDLVHLPESYEQWVGNIYQHSVALDKLKPSYKVYNYQSELSYFNYLGFRSLFYFKLFVWNKTNWDIPELGYFDIRRFRHNTSLNTYLKKLEMHYASYNSIDIWYKDLLTPILQQIKYYQSLGAFPYDEDVATLYNEIENLLVHLEKQCESGKKYIFGNPEPQEDINVFINQTHNNGNTLFIESESMNMTYGAFLNPNYIRTQDKHVNAYAKRWNNRALSQSIEITQSGEQARYHFFKGLRDQVRQSKSTVLPTD